MKRGIAGKHAPFLKAAVLFSLIAVLLLFTSAGKMEQGAGDVMRVGWGVEPDSLSPYIAYTQPAAEIFNLIYDSLVTFDDKLQPAPNLATEWKLSADQLTWTFTLRKGVKWHDGKPFTSADVKFTYEQMMESGLGLYADFLSGISSIECPDDYTVVIRTEKPKANMLMNTAPILPRHIWEKVSSEDLETWENESPVGTGPFKFVEWKSGEYVKLKANPDYFKGKPAIGELVFVLYANNDTMVQSLRTGELHAAINMNANQIKVLQQDPNVSVISAAANGFTELAINSMESSDSLGNPILLDTAVRRAMDYAIDKQNIIDLAYAGQGLVGTTLVPPDDFWHYTPKGDELRGYNPAKAKALLDQAGYRDTDGDGIREDANGNDLTFRFMLRADKTEEVKAGQMISAMLKAVGIGTDIETVDDGVLMDRIYAYDFDMFIWGWGTDVDPTTILRVMSTDQIGNLSDCNYSNPEFDRLLEVQATLMNKAERQKAVWEMQRILYHDSPYIILFYDNSIQAVRTDLWKGWKQIPEGGPYFFNLTTYNYLNVAPNTGN